jgi:hypothetical protein
MQDAVAAELFRNRNRNPERNRARPWAKWPRLVLNLQLNAAAHSRAIMPIAICVPVESS